MNSTLKKLLCAVMALAMVLAIVACQQPAAEAPQAEAPVAEAAEPAAEEPAAEEPAAERAPSTLVVGYSYFSEKFSPFFAKTAYDQDVAEITGELLMASDREGNPVLKGIEGTTVPFNGKDYLYQSISDIDIVQNDDGTVDYNVTIRDDVKFSDGEPMTIDDVIFTIYVECDPTYDGSTTFFSLPVEGMDAYRNSMGVLYKLILAAGEDNTDFTNWTEEQQKQYWAAFYAGGEKFAQEIVDYCISADYGTDVATAASAWGYELAADATAADFFKAIAEAYNYDIGDDGMNKETAGTALSDFIDAELGDAAASFTGTVNLGDAVPSITGIKKTGDYSMSVHCTKFEATSIYQFGLIVAPLHYYGDKAAFDFDNNNFGFTKGDLSGVKSKTTVPLGAGPYSFVSYQNGVVTFEANKNYYKGEPKTQYILFQETADGDKLSGVVSGTFDITDPSFSTDVVESIKGYNSNGELTGDVVTTSTVDNLGYGYIGMCAYNVKVGTGEEDGGTDASKALRKGLATVFAVHRDTVINSYYGDRASVIQYPISNTSWAAPKPNDEGYQIAFSVDVDGNPIYTDAMTEQERYDAALAACIGFLKAAGYTFDEATQTFTAAPEGAKLDYEIIIPGDGVGDHPSYGILTAVKEDLAKIGITLNINDPADSNVLWNAIEAVPSTGEIWCAAWGATPDPDMYQVYHSSSINGKGGTDSNHYYIADPQLDELMIEARTSSDQSFRKATYKQCLDIIIDWACEIPTYQRQNAFIFSTERVNLDTLTPDITTFWDWMHDLELIEAK